MNFRSKCQNENCKVTLTQRDNTEKDIIFLDVNVSFDAPTCPDPVSIRFDFPCIDTYSIFSPTIWSSRHMGPNWQKRTSSSRLSSGLPIHSLVSLGGRNRLTIALSDADTACELRTGIIEENGNHDVEIRLFTKPQNAISSYHATVRLDFSDIPYEESVKTVEKWWKDSCKYVCAYIPDHARLPMYSTWYSFHQNVDPQAIVEQCKLAKAMGMESVIVDDGWQTEDESRGYAFCGDWEVAKSKVPDMKNFVDAVHNCGMKFLIWFGVPFVGVNSKAYAKFQGKYLGLEIRNGVPSFAVLDPRYPEVRKHLTELYTNAVREWGLDGLKLDFIDSFRLYPDTPSFSEGWDTVSLDAAVNMLMEDITASIKGIDPEFMIEFRQTYVGPSIRKYGNMLRVCDCPLDALVNRRASTDLRLVSGESAVHSDMLMWNINDSVESAAAQMIATLFCVPQVSVMLDKIPESHKRMLEFYLSFWRKNRDVLLDGSFKAENPEAFYTLVSSEKNGHLIAVNYVETVLTLGDVKKLSYVNGSGKNTLTVRFDKKAKRAWTVLNCTGEVLQSGVRKFSAGVVDFEVPRAGMLIIE